MARHVLNTQRIGETAADYDLARKGQWANARELFTMDLRAGAEYYWNRETDPLEFNGSLAATYLRRITPRMQFTGNASLATSRSRIIRR